MENEEELAQVTENRFMIESIYEDRETKQRKGNEWREKFIHFCPICVCIITSLVTHSCTIQSIWVDFQIFPAVHCLRKSTINQELKENYDYSPVRDR